MNWVNSKTDSEQANFKLLLSSARMWCRCSPSQNLGLYICKLEVLVRQFVKPCHPILRLDLIFLCVLRIPPSSLTTRTRKETIKAVKNADVLGTEKARAYGTATEGRPPWLHTLS